MDFRVQVRAKSLCYSESVIIFIFLWALCDLMMIIATREKDHLAPISPLFLREREGGRERAEPFACPLSLALSLLLKLRPPPPFSRQIHAWMTLLLANPTQKSLLLLHDFSLRLFYAPSPDWDAEEGGGSDALERLGERKRRLSSK